MSTLLKFDREEQQLREQLAKLPRKKWKFLGRIPFCILFIFIGPYIPLRNNTMMGYMGYWEAVTVTAILLLVLMPFSIYFGIKEVNEEMLDIERKLIRLKYKRKESEAAPSSALQE
ncbi:MULTISPECIES: hypothetical protein [unclassified Myroides]|uniref:hypothetical protein n=1 Tax=unclassified Myroides TaxID=2642485 RepID=UPI003D2F5550